MQHLRVLEGADLVIPRREGRERWNHLNPLPIKEIHDRWIGPYAAQAVGLLQRMKGEMEGGVERDGVGKDGRPDGPSGRRG